MKYEATEWTNDLTRIVWKSRSGEDRVFFYEQTDERLASYAGWRFKVFRDEKRPAKDDWFVAEVTQKEPGIAAVTNLWNADKPWYTKKGIALVIIREAKRRIGGRLFSSSNKKPWFNPEWHTEDACNVWQTLVGLGYAVRHEEIDRFELITVVASAPQPSRPHPPSER